MDSTDTSHLIDDSAGHAPPTVDLHEERDTYVTQFDDNGRSPTEAVVDAVAAASDRDPLDLPPLHSVLDAEALDTLFGPRAGDTQGRPEVLTFEYAGHPVTVEGHGSVEVGPADPLDP